MMSLYVVFMRLCALFIFAFYLPVLSDVAGSQHAESAFAAQLPPQRSERASNGDKGAMFHPHAASTAARSTCPEASKLIYELQHTTAACLAMSTDPVLHALTLV